MAKQRIPQVPSRARPTLSDSWVVESDDDIESPLSTPHTNTCSRSPSAMLTSTLRQRPTEGTRKSPDQPSQINNRGNGQVVAEVSDGIEDSAISSSPTLDTKHATSSRQFTYADLDNTSQTRSARSSQITGYIDEGPRTFIDTTSYPSNRSRTTGGAKAVRASKRLANASEASQKNPNHAHTRHGAEPDLIMPSIHEDSPAGSWIGEERPRRRKAADLGSSILEKSQGIDRRENSQLRNPEPFPQVTLAFISENVVAFLKPIMGWVYDVTGGALGNLKTPISYFLAVYLFLGLLLFLRNLLTSSIYSALSPICRIPGSSLLSLPMCYSAAASAHFEGDEPPPVQFDRLMTVQSKFEAVLEETAGGVSLPLDMKRGETSIRDLRQVVRYSSLHSKNELVLEFDGFIETARIASYDLQKFNSHVGRGVDNILATARWTKRVLDGIALRQGSQGAIASFLNDKFLAPFQPLKFTEDALLDQYIQHTRIVEEEIHRLIAEAQALLLVLQNLEDRLDVIHGIAVRDDLHAQGSRAEILSQLWTKVGGNRGKLGKFNSQLRLLGQVNTYRQSAIAHVSGTMIKLQGMGAELEELRERVGGVELLGGSRGIPLSVHIENIELGVERLEKGRNRAKGVENEELRKTLERGKIGTKEIEGG